MKNIITPYTVSNLRNSKLKVQYSKEDIEEFHRIGVARRLTNRKAGVKDGTVHGKDEDEANRSECKGVFGEDANKKILGLNHKLLFDNKEDWVQGQADCKYYDWNIEVKSSVLEVNGMRVYVTNAGKKYDAEIYVQYLLSFKYHFAVPVGWLQKAEIIDDRFLNWYYKKGTKEKVWFYFRPWTEFRPMPNLIFIPPKSTN